MKGRYKLKIAQLAVFLILSLAPKLLLATNLIVDKTVSQLNLGPYVAHYSDATKRLEIADIIGSKDSLVWIPARDKQLNFGFSNAAIWLTVTLINNSDSTINRVIELPYSLIDNVEFYQINQHGRLLSNYIMGSEVHFSSRPVAHHNFVIPVKLLPNSNNRIFLRVTGNHSLQAPLTLWSNEAFWKLSQAENQFNFAYFSLLFAFMAYTLYRLSPQPRIRRIIFPGMVITPLLALLTIEGYAFQYVWPEHPFWNRMGLATLIPGSLTFLSLYLYLIFSKMAVGDRLHQFLLSLGVTNILLLIAPIAISYSVALILDLIAATIFFGVLCYLSIRYWHRLSRPNKVTLLGFHWVSISTFVFVLAITNIIPSFPIIEAPLQVGFFLFVFSLFWAQLNIYARAQSIFKKKANNLHQPKPPNSNSAHNY